MNMKEILEGGDWTWNTLLDIYHDFSIHYEERFSRLFGFFCFEMEVGVAWWGEEVHPQ